MARMLTTGKRVTRRVVTSQNPSCEGASSPEPSSLPAPMKGIDNRLILGPSSASTAGSSVSVAASATSTTRIAPMPRDWKNEKGTISSPQRAIITVTPLNSTVRPAVSPVFATASRVDRPRRISSLKREMMKSE